MIYHVLIHIISLDIAVFLATVSIISYAKSKNNKILLTSLSFVFLVVIEIFYLLQAGHVLPEFYIPFVDINFSHILLTCMIVLFTWGVLMVEKKH
jgi:hypothetical protein